MKYVTLLNSISVTMEFQMPDDMLLHECDSLENLIFIRWVKAKMCG